MRKSTSVPDDPNVVFIKTTSGLMKLIGKSKLEKSPSVYLVNHVQVKLVFLRGYKCLGERRHSTVWNQVRI